MLPRIGLTTTPNVLNDRAVAALDRTYIDAVVRAGGLPFVLPVLDPTQAGPVVSGLDGILLTGGGDVDPSFYGSLPSPHLGTVDVELDRWELALARAGAAQGRPMLGICRGAQVMNVAMMGTLVQHLPEVTDVGHCVRERSTAEVHDVRIDGRSRLATVVDVEVLGVNSLHHQAVADVGDGLTPVAWAEDGVVEAVEGTGPNRMLGVQWHPELLAEPRQRALFDWLSEEARNPRPAAVAPAAAA